MVKGNGQARVPLSKKVWGLYSRYDKLYIGEELQKALVGYWKGFRKENRSK